MSAIEQAAAAFRAYDAAWIEHLFRGAPKPDDAAHSYRHGWITIDGRSFDRETAFPGQTFPRFPADQGLSD